VIRHGAQAAKQQAKSEFDGWARSYDRSLLNHFLFQPSCHMFLEELARWQAGRSEPFDLLDVGSGTGTLAGMVALSSLPARHIVGLDYAMEMCQQARHKSSRNGIASEVHFVHGDSEHLPFADRSFDVVTCANSFHHYPHQQEVVLEMRRLLRPGGRLMIIDGFRDNIIGWVIFDVIITAIEKAVFHAPWPTMRSYFENAGFRDIRQRKFNILFAAFITIGTAN
jgi:ubiquinone/menaquinone biosynthesis C-methylase UbiE